MQLIFDVGANLGKKSRQFFESGAKVIAFEPQPIFCEHKNIIWEKIALSYYVGVTNMHVCNANTLSSMSKEFIDTTSKERFKNYIWDKSIEVKTNTLDNMIEKYGNPDYIKIDVEGYELQVLKGLTLPFKLISIEFTPELKHNTIACIEYLETNRTLLYNYKSQEQNEYKFNWISKQDIIFFIDSVKDYKIEFGDI